jgi:hypothetical protein
VDDIHFNRDRVNAFNPDSFLNPSNSRGLNSGLYNVSHTPKYSIVFLLRIQFPITLIPYEKVIRYTRDFPGSLRKWLYANVIKMREEIILTMMPAQRNLAVGGIIQ